MSTKYLSPSNEGLFLWQNMQRELYEALLTANLYHPFYQQPAEQLASIRRLIGENDPLFVARLAVYFREQLDLRTLAFALTAELAGLCKDKALTGRLAGRVIQQASEIPALLDHFEAAKNNGGVLKLPSELRKNLGVHFNRLDTYRYVRLTKAQQARLRHALSVVRPKAAGKAQQTLFRRIRQDRLPARNAWQSEYEALQGQHYDSPDLRQSTLRDKWKEGISAFRMGYKALLEKLPDVLAAGVSGKALKLAAEYLGNAAAVTGSGLPPWEFLEAYRRLHRTREGGAALLREAVEKATWQSVTNMAGVGELGRVVIAMDISPSMRHPVREGSLVQRYDIAPLLAMAWKVRGVRVSAGIIGNTWRQVKLPSAGWLDELDRLYKREGEAGYAIHAHLVIQELLRKEKAVDRVMVFTDTSLWNQRSFHQPVEADLGRWWRQYREIAPMAKLYLFDLAGYGKKPLECLEDGVYLIAGWNEKIFEVLGALEKTVEGMEALDAIIV
jgi:hypothetical protein